MNNNRQTIGDESREYASTPNLSPVSAAVRNVNGLSNYGRGKSAWRHWTRDQAAERLPTPARKSWIVNWNKLSYLT